MFNWVFFPFHLHALFCRISCKLLQTYCVGVNALHWCKHTATYACTLHVFFLILLMSFKKYLEIRQIKKDTNVKCFLDLFFGVINPIVNYCISLINYLFLLSFAHFKPRCKVKGTGTKVKNAKTKSDLIQSSKVYATYMIDLRERIKRLILIKGV